jgi:hypothetical protein
VRSKYRVFYRMIAARKIQHGATGLRVEGRAAIVKQRSALLKGSHRVIRVEEHREAAREGAMVDIWEPLSAIRLPNEC